MISKSKLKFIKSLQIKKYRHQEQCFLVEGAKSVLEVLDADFNIETILLTEDFLLANESKVNASKAELIMVNEKDLVAAGSFSSNRDALAVVHMKPNNVLKPDSNNFTLVLDDLRDPGNLGAIIRIADWYGINHIIASLESADCYNPKVITASMGSFTRVQLFYTDLDSYILQQAIPVFGAFMEGENVHEVDFGNAGLIVIGNEAHGISPNLEKLVSRKINIPRYGKAESLNAAVATAVICDNIRRIK
jgi:RNA methyltransferase, TrmH family